MLFLIAPVSVAWLPTVPSGSILFPVILPFTNHTLTHILKIFVTLSFSLSNYFSLIFRFDL